MHQAGLGWVALGRQHLGQHALGDGLDALFPGQRHGLIAVGLAHVGVGPGAGRRQDEPGHTFLVPAIESQGHVAAHREAADHHRPGQAQRVQQFQQVVGGFFPYQTIVHHQLCFTEINGIAYPIF